LGGLKILLLANQRRQFSSVFMHPRACHVLAIAQKEVPARGRKIKGPKKRGEADSLE
jgi:hypothetical protein